MLELDSTQLVNSDQEPPLELVLDSTLPELLAKMPRTNLLEESPVEHQPAKMPPSADHHLLTPTLKHLPQVTLTEKDTSTDQTAPMDIPTILPIPTLTTMVKLVSTLEPMLVPMPVPKVKTTLTNNIQQGLNQPTMLALTLVTRPKQAYLPVNPLEMLPQLKPTEKQMQEPMLLSKMPMRPTHKPKLTLKQLPMVPNNLEVMPPPSAKPTDLPQSPVEASWEPQAQANFKNQLQVMLMAELVLMLALESVDQLDSDNEQQHDSDDGDIPSLKNSLGVELLIYGVIDFNFFKKMLFPSKQNIYFLAKFGISFSVFLSIPH
jgi:hypothetical protein